MAFTCMLIIAAIQVSCEEDENIRNAGKEPKEIDITALTKQLVDSDNQFGFELFQKIAENQDTLQNTLISPVSVSLALAMTYNGAAGATQEGMEATLHLEGLSPEEINQSYQSLINGLSNADPKVTLEIANSIWYRQGFQVEQDFKDVNKNYYNAEVNELDFKNPEAVKTINEWVADKTHNKIEKIIEEIDPLTMMYLINALYFNGQWKYQFDENKTSQETFILQDGSSIRTDMMVTETDLDYFSNELFQAVKIPYGRGNYSMICFLPSGNHQVKDIVAAMTTENYNAWLSEFQEVGMQLYLPKFKFEYKKALKNQLKALGMAMAFHPTQADFSRINPDIDDLYISEVLHKTFIEVDEKGTEAAAVTAVVVNTTSAGGGSGPMIVRFDKPFVFAIQEKSTNTVAFAGALMHPGDEGE